jgi:hypothetical protein
MGSYAKLRAEKTFFASQNLFLVKNDRRTYVFT